MEGMMTKYALINDDDVVEVISFEPEEAPWVEVGDDVFAGDRRLPNGTFRRPPAPVVSDAEKQQEVDRDVERLTSGSSTEAARTKAIVRLIIEARDGDLNGLSEGEVTARYKEAIKEALRGRP